MKIGLISPFKKETIGSIGKMKDFKVSPYQQLVCFLYLD
jgi:hypothetical protein